MTDYKRAIKANILSAALILCAILCSPASAEKLEGPPWDLLVLFGAWDELVQCAEKGFVEQSDAKDMTDFLEVWVQDHEVEIPRSDRDVIWQLYKSGTDVDGPPTQRTCRRVREMAMEKFDVSFRSLASPF